MALANCLISLEKDTRRTLPPAALSNPRQA
jgi:hypothetical protein